MKDTNIVLTFCITCGLVSGFGAAILELNVSYYFLYGTAFSVYTIGFFEFLNSLEAWWKSQPSFKGFRYWWNQTFKEKG